MADKAGVGYETITAMKGVEQLDLLDANSTIVLARTDAGVLNLDVVALAVIARMRTQERGPSMAALFFFAACCRARLLLLAGVPRSAGQRPARASCSTPQKRARRSTWSTFQPPAHALAAPTRATRGHGVSRCGRPRSAGDARRLPIDGDRIVFTPMFPLDPGRQYHVTFTPPAPRRSPRPSRCPRRTRRRRRWWRRCIRAADVVPENQLRLYMHFSAPMGMKGGLDYVHLLDEEGKEVVDPFLPLDAEFFNDDRTRYTVFFDPGRQKRGIPVIADMGRSLTEGKSYTLVVDTEWRDGNGLPLKEIYQAHVQGRPAGRASARSRRRGRSSRPPPAHARR